VNRLIAKLITKARFSISVSFLETYCNLRIISQTPIWEAHYSLL